MTVIKIAVTVFCLIPTLFASDEEERHVTNEDLFNENMTMIIHLATEILLLFNSTDPLDANLHINVVQLLKLLNRTNPRFIHFNRFDDSRTMYRLKIARFVSRSAITISISLIVVMTLFVYYVCRRIYMSIITTTTSHLEIDEQTRRNNYEKVLRQVVVDIEKIWRYRRELPEANPMEYSQAWMRLLKIYEPFLGQNFKASFPLDFDDRIVSEQKKLMYVFCGEHPEWRVPVLTRVEREKLIRELERKREIERNQTDEQRNA
uniref:Uncharacterized protein n=1 Tax=Ascaris lumbricoides TaxID=6252 RepID=A0A0M3HSV8_ASCLU